MDPRLLAYWVAEADAVLTQDMARASQAVRAGMADANEYREWLNSLELVKSRSQQSSDAWESLIESAPRGYAGGPPI